jgi:hypothetical protein
VGNAGCYNIAFPNWWTDIRSFKFQVNTASTNIDFMWKSACSTPAEGLGTFPQTSNTTDLPQGNINGACEMLLQTNGVQAGTASITFFN